MKFILFNVNSRNILDVLIKSENLFKKLSKMIFKLALVLLALTHTISGFPGSSQVYPGQPISILEFKSTRTTKDFVFNSQALENILQHQDVIHRKISVISIMGAFRKGKSFLLDYFLRYMYTNVSLFRF